MQPALFFEPGPSPGLPGPAVGTMGPQIGQKPGVGVIMLSSQTNRKGFSGRPALIDLATLVVTVLVAALIDLATEWTSRMGFLAGRGRPDSQKRTISGRIRTLTEKPYKFIGFGDIHGPKPYKCIGFGHRKLP